MPVRGDLSQAESEPGPYHDGGPGPGARLNWAAAVDVTLMTFRYSVNSMLTDSLI